MLALTTAVLTGGTFLQTFCSRPTQLQSQDKITFEQRTTMSFTNFLMYINTN